MYEKAFSSIKKGISEILIEFLLKEKLRQYTNCNEL